MKTNYKSLLQLTASMMIFGTIGIFVRFLSVSSGILALSRAVIGVLFLLVIMMIKGGKPNFKRIRENLFFVSLSGVLIGINWVLLFEAYRYTSVATATLCYYLAPVFVILLSPLVLREHVTVRKMIYVLIALAGMILVSGIRFGEFTASKGIVYGIGAAVFYNGVILCNKKIGEISAYDKTITQLFFAAVIMGIYVLITEKGNDISISIIEVGLLFIIGIVHTGIAYALYFASMKELKASTIAIFSYIDPVIAILLSVLVLKEHIKPIGIIGAVLILGATLLSSLPEQKKI